MSTDGAGSIATRRLTALRALSLVALAFTFGNVLWAAWDQDLTYDEYFHLEWPRRLLEERLDGRDAFRFDSKTPALLPGVLLRKAAVSQGIDEDQILRFSTRLCSVLYLGVCLFLLGRIAGVFGPEAFWIAVLLGALDPNLAAHASIATSDVAYTLSVLLLAGALVRKGAGGVGAALVGTALGVAFAMKFSAVLLVPVAFGAVIWTAASWRDRLAHLGIAVLAALVTVNTLYLWVGVFQPLGSLDFATPALRSIAAAMPSLRIPLPGSVLTGIDASSAHNSADYWICFLLGHEHPGGVWYYFVAVWLIKTPLVLIGMVLYGLWRLRAQWRDRVVLVLGTVFLIHLAYFSLLFNTQIGLRFALPCIALACALAAIGLRGALSARLLFVLVGFSVLERAPYFGDPLAFTNPVVWTKSRAYWYVSDSNLDYGQNRERVHRYAKALQLPLILDQKTVTPGNYVVSANDLTITESRGAHKWLTQTDVPAILVGFTHFAFSITGDRFEDYMNASRVAPAQRDFGKLCGVGLTHYPPGAQIEFDQRAQPEDERTWVVCASSRKGVDVGFTVTAGRIRFGRVLEDGTCDAATFQAGQQAWYRVPRGGQSELCLVEIPYRRRSLPYLTSGYFTVRGQGADVAIERAPAMGRPTSLSEDQ